MAGYTNDKVRVMKLTDATPRFPRSGEEVAMESDAMVMFRIMSLLGGASEARDLTVGNRLLR